MVSVTPIQLQPSELSSGGRLVSVDGRELPLESTALKVDAAGGIARVVIEQRFRNPYPEALTVKYLLPIPAEGAISGFSFKIGSLRVEGEIDKKARARERFERAIVEGKSAAILEQSRSTVFQQEVGNIPPGEKIVTEIVVDQRLIWLSEGAWEWRFPTVVGARYMGAKGRVADAAQMNVAVADKPLAHKMKLAMSVKDALSEGGRFESPSHEIEVVRAEGRSVVALSDASGARLDRDVVIRWPVAKHEIGASLHAARPASPAHEGRAYGLLTLVPPDRAANMTPLARDLIVLIDTSGSMDGKPLKQAQRVACAMIDTLDDEDRLELIEFSSYPRRFRSEPLLATRDGKRAAIQWVQSLKASGSTEMKDALLDALKPLRKEAQRQIVLITDGYIGFEDEILETVHRKLPRGSRIHTIGVGEAVNRSLTEPLARAGAGVEVVIGVGEDAERAAQRLIERTAEPLLTELRVEGLGVVGSVPARLPDVFAGCPVMIAAELRPAGGEVIVRGRTSSGDDFVYKAVAPSAALGAGNAAITALFGRELVADLEVKKALRASEIDAEIEEIGLRFQIATRLTSWVAISREATIAEGTARRREEIAQEAPHGVSVAGMGIRGAMSPAKLRSVSQASLSAEREELVDEDDDVAADRTLSFGKVSSADDEEVTGSIGGAFDLDVSADEPVPGRVAPSVVALAKMAPSLPPASSKRVTSPAPARPAGATRPSSPPSAARAPSPAPITGAAKARLASPPPAEPSAEEGALEPLSARDLLADESDATLRAAPKLEARPQQIVEPKIEVEVASRSSRRLAILFWLILVLGIAIGLLIALLTRGGT